jgi:hypothetical protein
MVHGKQSHRAIHRQISDAAMQKVTRRYGKNFNFPKHHLKAHVIADIRQAGVTSNFTTRTGEGIHQEMSIAYRTASNGKEAEEQVYYMLCSSRIIANAHNHRKCRSHAKTRIRKSSRSSELELTRTTPTVARMRSAAISKSTTTAQRQPPRHKQPPARTRRRTRTASRRPASWYRCSPLRLASQPPLLLRPPLQCHDRSFKISTVS